MAQDQKPKSWYAARFTHGGIRGSGNKSPYSNLPNQYNVILLNNHLENTKLLVDICAQARHVVCADGGANRFHDLHLTGKEERTCFPYAIVGDMDSLRPDVEEHYRSQHVKIVKDPDQYSTDLQKCLKYIEDHMIGLQDEGASPRRKMDVAIFGSLGGRADQAFSQLHHLYASSQNMTPMIGDLYLITTESVMFLLEKGKNSIYAPVGPEYFTENVGIIPIGRPSIITTHGLEWDVTDWSTEFGTQMSTSNHIRAEKVEVDTSERVLFTLEIAKKPGH
ncbi:thiamine pyrophosphokinase [Usnea florida]